MNFFPEFFTGLLFTILLFVFSVIIVLGCKCIYLLFKKPNIKPIKPQNPSQQHTKKTRPIRSIEIDPDDVDRIYVRKPH